MLVKQEKEKERRRNFVGASDVTLWCDDRGRSRSGGGLIRRIEEAEITCDCLENDEPVIYVTAPSIPKNCDTNRGNVLHK